MMTSLIRTAMIQNGVCNRDRVVLLATSVDNERFSMTVASDDLLNEHWSIRFGSWSACEQDLVTNVEVSETFACVEPLLLMLTGLLLLFCCQCALLSQQAISSDTQLLVSRKQCNSFRQQELRRAPNCSIVRSIAQICCCSNCRLP